jgi:hypothetical protein
MSRAGKENTGPVDPFQPDALNEVQGPDYSPEPSVDEVDELLEETSETVGSQVDVFDAKKLDSSLPDRVPAATVHKGSKLPFLGYERTDLHVNPDLFELPRYEQRHVMAHEGIHGLHFQDELLEEVGDEVPEEVMDELYHRLAYGTEEELEGATELLARYINPESPLVGEKFRRDEARKVEQEIDSELVEDIQSLKKDLIDEYREVYNTGIGENFYMEAGNFAGEEYIAVVKGEDADLEGEEVVMEHLEEISSYVGSGETYGVLEDGNYEGSDCTGTPGDVAPNNSINWDGWDEKLEL